MDELETADTPGPLRRVVLDPLTRVEGHGKVTLLLDDDGRVRQARLHIVEFRGFERFIQGRPYWELPQVVQRLCGICPVSHHLAAGKAIDHLLGIDALPPAADRARRLLHFAQTLQSHALHFFYLAAPDLLFGFQAPAAQRNLAGVLEAHPDIARQGISLRRFGQELIEALAGKRIHGSLVVPGGVNRHLDPQAAEELRQRLAPLRPLADQAVQLARDLYLAGGEAHRAFAPSRLPFLSLANDEHTLELYQGALQLSDARGEACQAPVAPSHYRHLIAEAVKPWSYMKFPYLKALGADAGSYRVGPLARVLSCRRIATPAAEDARQALRAHLEGDRQSALLYHWARMVELLHCCEMIEALLGDSALYGGALQAPPGQRRHRGIGVIEAPRGTLIHDYAVDADDLVTEANLIVATTHNNQAMNAAIRDLARHHLDDHPLDEGLLNQVEVAIRAYDPCLSCATHALGTMPLILTLQAPDGSQLAAIARMPDGEAHALD